jgi:hypothetical protein
MSHRPLRQHIRKVRRAGDAPRPYSFTSAHNLLEYQITRPTWSRYLLVAIGSESERCFPAAVSSSCASRAKILSPLEGSETAWRVAHGCRSWNTDLNPSWLGIS